MSKLKVTFDSNTWQQVASPVDYVGKPFHAEFVTIRKALDDGRLEAYLSETIFTLEAIEKTDRKAFFGTSKLRSSSTEEVVGDTVKINLTLARDTAGDPRNTGLLKKYFKDASAAGFKILRFPRNAGVSNADVEEFTVRLSGDALAAYHDKLFKVGRRVEDLKAGVFHAKQIAEAHSPGSGLTGLGAAPDSENKKIAKAVAEWADGDSVASHIAIGGDYFCTLDQAKGAGAKSVMSAANLAVLSAEFGLKTITPAALALLLSAPSPSTSVGVGS
ncbi:MAG: hypothetical protein IPK70_05130 [Flavobacteriales bacterium]|nr:hypothetical protein [Flavobacteriales bacterium]